MKLHIIYLRTMDDSPEVKMTAATTSMAFAKEELRKARQEEAEWMEGKSEGDGDWAEACMSSFNIPNKTVPIPVRPGDAISVFVETMWYDGVETTVEPFPDETKAGEYLELRKRQLLGELPGITPYDDGESLDETRHLYDEEIQLDVFFDIVNLKLL